MFLRDRVYTKDCTLWPYFKNISLFCIYFYPSRIKALIDGVIHVKPNPDKYSPILFRYGISRSIDEIRSGAKTKYYPVELSEVLHLVKTTPGKYAIIGIPSFIMAVRLLAEKDEIVRERIKYTVGLICGHQKSSKFAEALAWQVGIKPGNLKQIDFRKKLLDRSASEYAVEMTGLIDGQEVTVVRPTSELLGQNWGQGFFKTTASDFTDDVMNETADITLGDAWLPEYTKDSKRPLKKPLFKKLQRRFLYVFE